MHNVICGEYLSHPAVAIYKTNYHFSQMRKNSPLLREKVN